MRGPDCVVFFDWDEGVMIRKIDVVPREVRDPAPSPLKQNETPNAFFVFVFCFFLFFFFRAILLFCCVFFCNFCAFLGFLML